MKLSARERYGLRAMVEFARHYGSGPVTLGEVAAAQDISLSYLEQIVAPLRRAGLLDSARGARGGYVLARAPEEITVADVLRVLEGAIFPLSCVGEEETCAPCAREAVCTARTVWQKVRDDLLFTLDSTTLADLAARPA